MDDWQLLREYATRNSGEAFRALVDRYAGLVYHAALRQAGNPHTAEEVTQAVFIALAQKADRLPRGAVLSGWLFRATRFAFNNLAREQIRRQRREQEAVMMETILRPDETASVWEQIVPHLNNALDKLPRKDREAVLIRFFQDKSHRELARILGVSEDAAKVRVSRALEKLRLIFARQGFAVPSAVLLATISAHGAQAVPAGLTASVASVAVAKGTAGTTSTLTIAKGVLKIMAWTKAKTAVVVGAGILFAAGTTTITIKEIQAPRTHPWQVHPGNITSDQVNQPPQVRILPSKFHISDWATIGGKMIGTGVRAQNVVASAYGFFASARVVFNADLPTNRFDYIACLLDGESANEAALQREVKKKFGVVGRIETRNADVWLLKAKSPNPPGLKRNDKDTGNGYWSTPTGFHGWHESMLNLATFLEDNSNVPVTDATGLTDHFDFDLNCKQTDLENRNWDAVNRALDRFGLELVPTNMPIEMLVVEKAK